MNNIQMLGIKINLKKTIRWILVVAVIIGAVLIIRRYMATRGYESAVGDYITTGGQSYLVINKGFLYRLHIDEGIFILNETILSHAFPVPKINAKFRNNRLFIYQTEHGNALGFMPPHLSSFGIYPVKEVYQSMMVLEPSQSVAGDWDLVDLKISVKKGGVKSFLHLYFWQYLFSSKSFKVIKHVISKTIRSRETLYFELNPTKAPIRSFLHRVDDSQITEYFRARLNETPSDKTLAIIREITSRNPNDSYLRLHEVEQEALHGNGEKAEELWKKWEEENKTCLDTLLLKNAQHVSWIVFSSRFRKDYPDLAHYNDAFSRTSSLSLEDKKLWMMKLSDTGQIIFPEYPLVYDLYNPGYKSPSVPDLLNFQVTVKALKVTSIMDLFLGKREENLRVLSGLFLLGSSLRMDHFIITTLIGVAVQNITVHSLEIYALNACEKKEDLEEFYSVLEILNTVEKTPMESGNPYYNSLAPILSHTKASGKDMPNYLEHQTRSQIADTRFQLLRMAVAAKYNLFTTGDFPKVEKDFAFFLSEALPEDAFSGGNPLKFTQPAENEFFVYSIGPDKTDDKAAFSYDPTNGTITPGDIFIQIPREREFPFPREGVRASNAHQLLEQFPNGLPADPFADTRSRPFSILESTETQPVVIFSFGPNTDEANFTPYTAPSSKEMGGKFDPVPTPEPPSNASYGRSLQWVMRRSEEIPPPPGHWTLEPMYDPTNGATSNGDLFIEIPGRK